MPGTVDNKGIYHLGVLIPFWVLQLINVILLLAFAALELQFIISLYSYKYCYNSIYDGQQHCSSYYDSDTAAPLGVAAGATGLAIGLSVIFLIMHITQIALFGRKKLTPSANFGFELPRVILLLLDIILEAAGAGLGLYDYAVLPLTCVLWLLYLGTLIYASVIFHRYRRGGNGGRDGNHGHYPNTYEQAPCPQGPYQQGPYQQEHYQQGYFQQAQYPQVPHRQNPYQAYSPHQTATMQDQPMQNLHQLSETARHFQTHNHPTLPQMHQYPPIPNYRHGQPDASPMQAHGVPAASSSPPPQELKSDSKQ